MTNRQTNSSESGITLVTGGTGKTGRRVAQRLKARGIQTRVASRSADPSFDWHDAGSWDQVLSGVSKAYISYAPDLAIPGATDLISRFVSRAVDHGVQHLVLLSGRGEAEAQASEQIVQSAGVDWTIVRASWFMQNFSEGEFLPMVLDGAITLPARDIPEPFIDVNDIADVAAAALTEDGHAGQLYELTGPRLLTFSDLAREISQAAARDVQFARVPRGAFAQALTESGAPKDIGWLLNYLFDEVLDGHNAYLCDGVQRALGREPADFSDFARRIAARSLWQPAAKEAAA